MNDLLFLVPLVVGLGIMALGFKLQIPKGQAMNRPVFGIALLLGSLFWWLSSALLLVQQGKFFFILNMLTVFVFFTSLAFFFPQKPNATRPNQHSLPATILVWLGLIFGLAHSLALMFTTAWPTRLLEFYSALGLHGTPPTP